VPSLFVSKQEDWLTIAQLGGPVVDPMILRCGELFLQGATGVRDANAAWDLLTRNIHALGTFFDRLILDERIPVFNYADTFDHGHNFDQRTLGQVNVSDEVLVDVKVDYAQYMEVKSAAMEELRALYDGGQARVDPNDAYSILGELSSSGYAWYPQLDGLTLANPHEERLAAYILGGLIFGSYAQLAGTDHFMQPKRSRLFLAISLQQKSDRALEERLFKSLGELAGWAVADIPYTPTFFPMLLAESDGPRAVLTNALELRRSGEVRDYRQWLRDALQDFSTNGRIGHARELEVSKIADAIRKKLKGGHALPEVKLTVAEALAAKPPSVDLTAPAKALWGWFVDQLPRRRHRKLLTRAILAHHDYVELDRRVNTVFQGPGFGSA